MGLRRLNKGVEAHEVKHAGFEGRVLAGLSNGRSFVVQVWFLYHAYIDKSCFSPAPISSAKMVIMPSLCVSSGSVVGGGLYQHSAFS